MGTWKTYIFLLLFGVFLFSCGTTEVKTDLAKLPKPSRIYNPELTKPKKNTGVVVIKLDKGNITALLICPEKIYLNSKPIAELHAGEKIVLYLPPDFYDLRIEPQAVCRIFPTSGILSASFYAKKNVKYVYRIKIAPSGYFLILESQGQIKNLKE